MRLRSRPILVRMRKLANFLLWFGLLCTAIPQSGPPTPVPQSKLEIIKLPPASYPAIAMAARVSGRVELNITLRPDGNVDSAEAVSGPEMLRTAAIESAHQMQFECKGCIESTNKFRLSLNYEFDLGYSCEAPDKSYPHISESNGTVIFTGQPPSTCDPSESISWIRVRSAKCFYLWSCGRRTVTPK